MSGWLSKLSRVSGSVCGPAGREVSRSLCFGWGDRPLLFSPVAPVRLRLVPRIYLYTILYTMLSVYDAVMLSCDAVMLSFEFPLHEFFE
jgi:hypothetical protein